MNTLWKALLATFLIIILAIGLPILIALVGVIWPIILIVGLLIFVPVAVGIVVGKNTKDE